MSSNFVIAVSVADVRRDPDPDSELVTQALMNVPALAGAVSGEWTHVTLSEGQERFCVRINSLNPTSPLYSHRQATMIWAIKRVRPRGAS